MNKRLKPEIRKNEILAAAVIVAEREHYAHMTREQIATAAGVAGPTVQHYLGTMNKLRRSVMRAAVRSCNLTVIAQGLVAKDVHAVGAPEDLKAAALAAL